MTARPDKAGMKKNMIRELKKVCGKRYPEYFTARKTFIVPEEKVKALGLTAGQVAALRRS